MVYFILPFLHWQLSIVKFLSQPELQFRRLKCANPGRHKHLASPSTLVQNSLRPHGPVESHLLSEDDHIIDRFPNILNQNF